MQIFLDLLAFDNSISKKSAAIKGIKNLVGDADVLLVPNVEGNALVKMNGLVKMMIYILWQVLLAKVPVVITSRLPLAS